MKNYNIYEEPSIPNANSNINDIHAYIDYYLESIKNVIELRMATSTTKIPVHLENIKDIDLQRRSIDYFVEHCSKKMHAEILDTEVFVSAELHVSKKAEDQYLKFVLAIKNAADLVVVDKDDVICPQENVNSLDNTYKEIIPEDNRIIPKKGTKAFDIMQTINEVFKVVGTFTTVHEVYKKPMLKNVFDASVDAVQSTAIILKWSSVVSTTTINKAICGTSLVKIIFEGAYTGYYAENYYDAVYNTGLTIAENILLTTLLSVLPAAPALIAMTLGTGYFAYSKIDDFTKSFYDTSLDEIKSSLSNTLLGDVTAHEDL